MKLVVAALALSSLAGCLRTARGPEAPIDALEPVPWVVTATYDELGKEGSVPCATGCAAVLSFRIPPEHPLAERLGGRSYVYDDALAMLVHLAEGHPERALPIGRTLVALRNPDGTIGFSFDFEKSAFVDARYVRAGTVAWAGYALASFDLVTGTSTFAADARRVADALLATRVSSPGDPRDGLVLAGRGLWRDNYRVFDATHVADHAVTEHQIDLYFLLRALDALEPGPYGVAADALAGAMLRALWRDDEGVFTVAVGPKGQSPHRALDSAGAWGAMFLLAIGDVDRARRSLASTRTRFATVADGIAGFAPYDGPVDDHEGQDLSHTFFSEGTASMAVLLSRSGDAPAARALHSVLAGLCAGHGGAVPYAFPESPDFPNVPAVAPTAWLRLFEREQQTGSPLVLSAPARPIAKVSEPVLLTRAMP